MKHLRLVALGMTAGMIACGGAQPAPAAPGAPVASATSPSGAPASASIAAPSASVAAPSATMAASSATPPAASGPEGPGAAAGSATAPATAGATSAGAAISPALRAVVDAPDRTDADRKLDAGRHPAELLAFASVRPGMHVAEIQAGGGYTTEILARAVGPSGVVYSQNNKFVVERFAQKPWTARLAKPALKNVVRVERELEDPLPPEAKDLDAVFVVLFYHDSVWSGTDRDKMNRAILRALRPGGEYVVVDHSAAKGTGLRDVKTLHRIDEQSVTDEIAHAGFRLADHADFLRNPSDTRDWNDSPTQAGDRRGTSDRFVLRFVKP